MNLQLDVLAEWGWRTGATAVALVTACLIVLDGARAGSAADPHVSQCVACHTDAGKLKALTPPDPPPTEEGEG